MKSAGNRSALRFTASVQVLRRPPTVIGWARSESSHHTAVATEKIRFFRLNERRSGQSWFLGGAWGHIHNLEVPNRNLKDTPNPITELVI